MALRGTLDTFALPDVLQLLGATAKTGRLRITGDRGTGSVWVVAGDIVVVEATHAPHATTAADALFELLRFQDGSFTFDADALHDDPGAAHDVDALLGSAAALLEEWRAIETVVPSMDLWVTLRPALDGSAVTLDQGQWSTIVAVGFGATVRRVGDELCLAELPVSRAIVRLVEAGLVDVSEMAPAGSPRVAPERGIEPLRALPVELGEPVESFEAFEPVGEADAPIEPDARAAEGLVEVDVPVEVIEPADVVAPRPGPRARRARSTPISSSDVPAETGLFVPLDLPGHGPAASYDARPAAAREPEPAAVEPEPPVAEPTVDAPDELEELVASFPGLAGLTGVGGAVSDLDDDEIAQQLAALSPRAAKAILAAATSSAEGEAGDGDPEGQGPSRGLLLKFLSSVKS